MNRTTRAVLLTVLYWSIALFILGLSMLPECLVDVAPCEATKRTTAVVIFSIEVGLYALILRSVLQGRSRIYWLGLTLGIAAIVALYLAGRSVY